MNEQSQMENSQTQTPKRPLALIILDGWGYSDSTAGNAIALAHTPNYDEISLKYPKTLLAAAGLRVGLPTDTAGSSEVGHLNLGAGRIIQTDVAKISTAIKTGAFFQNKVLKRAFEKAKAENSAVHLVGLLSDGGVHSSPETLFALLRYAKYEGIEKVFLHCILDGRDVAARQPARRSHRLRRQCVGLWPIAHSRALPRQLCNLIHGTARFQRAGIASSRHERPGHP